MNLNIDTSLGDMAPPKSKVPPAAHPNFGAHFDSWNSSSTGHQRAENRLSGSTGWRVSRTTKLHHQFKSGGTGGKRISDHVGAGSENWDEKAKALIPKDVRAKVSVTDMLVGKGKSNTISTPDTASTRLTRVLVAMTGEEKIIAQRKVEDELKEQEKLNRKKEMFHGLVIYINGSTHPLISDHKLKQLLAENGARISISLARKQVTHVILGRPSGNEGSGAGGGLAGTKMEKEIRRIGGCGVKYVGVEWYRSLPLVPETFSHIHAGYLKV